MSKDKEDKLCCSFCFKGSDEVDRLFVSFQQNASICNECILLCIGGIFKETAEKRLVEAKDFDEHENGIKDA